MALAHAIAGDAPIAQSLPGLATWSADPWLWFALVLPALVYGAGVRALWQRTAFEAGITRREALAFMAGWLVLVLSTMSPLDALASLSFAAHMVQHEMMVVVAAPLLVLGRPLPTMLWGLPPAARRRVARGLRASGLSAAVAAGSKPVVAATLHGAVLWAWHLPPLVALSTASSWAHHAQHAAFLVSALLFWSAVLARGGAPHAPAIGMAWLLFTLLHTSMLGALLAFAPSPWFPHYVASLAHTELGALQDQQLAGLVMWVPGGIAYLVAALALLARLTRQASPALTPPPSAPR